MNPVTTGLLNFSFYSTLHSSTTLILFKHHLTRSHPWSRMHSGLPLLITSSLNCFAWLSSSGSIPQFLYPLPPFSSSKPSFLLLLYTVSILCLVLYSFAQTLHPMFYQNLFNCGIFHGYPSMPILCSTNVRTRVLERQIRFYMGRLKLRVHETP